MSRVEQQTHQENPSQPEAGRAPMSSPQQVCELLGSPEITTSDRPEFGHRRIRAGQHLVRAGDDFHELYVVNGGYFKTVVTDDAGNEQILNFPMKGGLIGADGIGTRTHINDVVALTDTDIIVIPFDSLDSLTQIAPRIEESLFRSISQQLIDEQLTMTAIGSLSVETRLARFLIKLGDQLAANGYSRDTFLLQMSRGDLGNYLGMKIETVSRTLTAMTKRGLISVEQREIKIVDRAGLEAISRGTSQPQPAPARKAVKATAPAKSKKRRATSRAKASAATPWSGLVGVAA